LDAVRARFDVVISECARAEFCSRAGYAGLLYEVPTAATGAGPGAKA
jgi:hypothetical protein